MYPFRLIKIILEVTFSSSYALQQQPPVEQPRLFDASNGLLPNQGKDEHYAELLRKTNQLNQELQLLSV